MKKIIIIGFLLTSQASAFAQSATEEIKSDSIPLINMIKEIERTTSYKFYYRQDWLENTRVVAEDVIGKSIMEQLTIMLSETALTYYKDETKIILINNGQIVTPPAIASSLEATSTNPEKNEMFFAREISSGNGNIENQLFPIGNRSKYVRGERSTIAGYITDIESGEPVDGAYIYLADMSAGTSCDENGFYALTLPNGRQELIIQSVSMINSKRRIILFSDGKLDIELEPDQIALNNIVVSAMREQNIKETQMGIAKVSIENVKVVPTLLGERDIIRVATLTAGVQNVGEGSAGLNIRGGKADQNLFLLDGSTVYNTNHFFGFFSIFNPDVISGMELYKSAMPAEYGGRLSSVFDIATKSPNTEKLSVQGGISPVTSRLMVEGPIGKKGPSFIIGGRATYSDYVLKQLENSSLKNNNASFYDLLGKFYFKLNDKNIITLTGYYSNDNFQMASDTLLSYTDFNYVNQVGALNWKHIINTNLHGVLEAGVSRYQYGIGYDLLPTKSFNIDFNIDEYKISEKFDYYINERLNLFFGLETKFIKLNPGNKYPIGSESLVAYRQIENEQGLVVAPYISATYNYSERFAFDAGLRYSIFSLFGPATVNKYADGSPRMPEFIVGTEEYSDNEHIKTYHGPEVRLSGRYSLNRRNSIKISYNRTRQNMHLLINSASIAPTDIWRLSSTYIKPQVADQFSVGFYKNLAGKHVIETSIEAYYKNIQNLLDIKVGADLQFNPNVETAVLQGQGKSFGVEVSLKKSNGWLTGWLNYTYSRSLIKLDGAFQEEIINNGSFFPTGYDKPHYINSVTNYKFTRRLTMTLGLVYSTGIPVTLPVGKWYLKSSENIFYSDRNAHRIPDYFRLDLGVNLEGNHKTKKFIHSSWSFSVYNLLGRDNIYSVFFKVENGEVQGYKLSVFTAAIPTITYNFRF